uniref:Centrosomal protein 350 n=1 Tax=Cyprinodon variegatus TaxID=28743 RepID=A0A3Q2DIS8_CYPVA
ELTNAWKSLAQSKAALRHIENRLEATPGTGVLLDTFSPKKKTSGTSHTRDGRQADVSRRNTKPRGENHQNPAKSNSRSPLRNATQDSNVRKSSSVEFKEPLASYRYRNLLMMVGHITWLYLSLMVADLKPFIGSQLIYQKVTRDKQTDRDLESTHSSAVESAEVRYINDQPVLDSLKTEQSSHKAQLVMDNHESNPCLVRTPGSSRQGESSPSTSPGSVSQRLENLRRHQPDDKLEKLKERIRRQRQHLEETAQGEALKGHLKKPVVAFAEGDSVGSSSMPAAKIRKVTSAPPAPIYKGFNSTETKIQTPDGKVWKEEEFQSLSKEIYGDISQQFSGKGRLHKATLFYSTIFYFSCQKSRLTKPSFLISPASWREGQKLVKMVLGPPPKLPREEPTSHPAGKQTQAGGAQEHELTPLYMPAHERPRSGFQEKPSSRPTTSYNHSSSAKDRMPQGVNTDVLAVDIQGILDDLQLDCKPAEMEERALPTSSSRGCRSASPTKRQHDDANKASKGQKKRHYDADTVRQYIAQQQEERKRRQVEEKRAAKEEAERRNQRLAELYKKQREVAKTVTLSTEAAVAPVQKRLQETYTKLLLEDARLGEEQPAHLSAPIIQMRPLYQPSGESDKENKRLEVSQSPSSSDKSLNELPPPPLSRNDLEDSFSLQPDHLNPVYQPTNVATSSVQVSSNEHLLSQILRLDAAMAASSKYSERPAVAPQSHTRMSRIEALKAKATSLSNRIETEARRFAGQEINYGAPTSMDVDTVLPPRNSNVDFEYWTEIPAYATENSDKSFRVHKAATSAGYTTYTDTALPGAENLHDLVEKTYTSLTNPHTVSPGKENPEDRIKNKREENAVFPYQSDLHDLSSGSISEGPLLSEGSFSEGDSSPPQYYSNRGRNVDYLEAADNRAGKSSNHNRLLEFQRDAAKCAALSPPFSQLNGSKAPWEELNKGSPLSVINIFTKNVQGHVKGNHFTLYKCLLVSFLWYKIILSMFTATISDQSDATLVEELKGSPLSEANSSDHRRKASDKSLNQAQDKSLDSDTLGGRSLNVTDIFSPCIDFFLPGELQYSPAVLRQRMAAEMHYLESIEESIKQLGDAERLMGVSMAQQESASLAQMLKLQENLAASQKQTLEGLQESASKMVSQQAEAARYTADAARHIKEVSSNFLLIYLKTKHYFRVLHVKLILSNSGRFYMSDTPLHPLSSQKLMDPYHYYITSGSTLFLIIVLGMCITNVVSVPSGETTSVATEYSLKFDQSMTEDDIEECSFRSLLPSEAHRRGTMQKKLHHQREAEDFGASLDETLSKDAHIAFSSGQDSFSKFTMEMVRQYMKDEEVRLQHQSSLLHLRQKALKEKTRTELAWLEHQKKKLRDKGEDDKMPPIRKKQRGLLLKLQQEQAEIKRLQEANKAARKERQLLLKQQEEIERMRNSTLRLKERLKCAEGEAPPVRIPCVLPDEMRSPSPSLSISGSETSSIMQKLKKMQSHMDEKFLTRREQQLMQRRHHAEELLQWKQQLDQEEAEVRRMEREALAAWDLRRPLDKDRKTSESDGNDISETGSQASHRQSLELRYDSEKGEVVKCGLSPTKHGTKLCSHSSCDSFFPQNFPAENISDQSDIESRIKALREELRKRKIMAYQLKKEQKKRHKERLKAQEAQLLKKLENYNDFIEKTKAELNKEPDSTPDTTSNINDSSYVLEQSSIKPSLHRYAEEIQTMLNPPIHRTFQSASKALPEDLPNKVPKTPTVTEYSRPSGGHSSGSLLRSLSKPESEDEKVLSDNKSDIEEQLDVEVHSRSEDEQSNLLKPDSQEKITASKQDPPIIESSRATPTFDTQDEVEEEIPEEISRPASAGEQDLHSEKLVDFQHNGEDLKCENKTEFSSQGVASPLVLDEMPGFQLGDRVLVGGVQPGTLRFKGPTSFANGFWAGVELDKSEGSNNGTYDGVVYFECEESHGIFAPPDKVSHLPDKFELYADTTEDEDSFFDDLSDKGGEQQKKVKGSPQKPKDPEIKNDQTFNKDNKSRDVKDLDEKDQIPLDSKLILNSQHQKKPEHQICHVNLKDVILDLNEASHESPVFGPSGQEELAKRLAELELSRELLDDIGDDQDWFDEDFGLSSRRQQPELPLPLPPKLPEQPAMIVPHSATEVEKMVHSATQEIWEAFGLGKEGALILEQLSKPTPSLEYLGKDESKMLRSYKSRIFFAVFDLTWELLKEIFAEDPNTDQPQWVKPRQVKSSFIHRVKTAGDINKIQEFVTEEVLKLYGLKQDQSQKTDWQKMLKFGRKKRDRVDHILAQELHEEEAQWVNYDEDELCVKLQLADSIFQTLLMGVNILLIQFDPLLL